MFGASNFTLALSVVLAIAVISAILMCDKVVKQAECMVIERFGKYNRTLKAGINFIIPIMDSARSLHTRVPHPDPGVSYVMTTLKTSIDLREQVFDFAKQNVITKDNVNMNARIKCTTYNKSHSE